MKNTLETKILGNVTADNQKSDLVWTAGLFFFFSSESKSSASHYNTFWEISPITC